MNIIAVIPARGGSKGVPKKNIVSLCGYPLIAYSIIASKLCPSIGRTIVSTDSQEIADIARAFGAETPFLRPKQFAGDKSTDTEVFAHTVDWFKKNEGTLPDLMVQLRPTTPLREPHKVELAIKSLQKQAKATSLRSAHEFHESPHKMFQLSPGGFFEGFFPDDPRQEYYNLPRQMFPKAYHPNGYVDIIKTHLFIKNQSLYGHKILGFVTPFAIEVDEPQDIDRLSFEISKNGNFLLDYLRKWHPIKP